MGILFLLPFLAVPLLLVSRSLAPCGACLTCLLLSCLAARHAACLAGAPSACCVPSLLQLEHMSEGPAKGNSDCPRCQLAGACARVDAEDARRRRRRSKRGPTGSSAQAVPAACCAVYAGAEAGAAREGEGEEGAVFARFYCTDLGRAALQLGTDTPPPSL